MDVCTLHGRQPAVAADELPSGVVGAVANEVWAVGVCEEDGFEDVFVGERRDRVALGGADAVAGGGVVGVGGG